SHLQHVRIIPAVRTRVFLQSNLLVEDLQNGAPTIADVSSRAPEMTTDGLAPQPRLILSPLTEAVHNGPSCCPQRHAHRGVTVARGPLLAIAVVIFEVVDSPLREHARVRDFVIQTGRSLL